MRVVPAASLLRHFASDRSHMRRPDGSWSAPPPQYPCISAQDGSGCCMNLQRYRDMECDLLQDRQQQGHAQGGTPSSSRLGRMPVLAAAGAALVGVPGCAQQQEQQGATAWHDIASAAASSTYGVVVEEATLLRCLLGQQFA
jgi:hypothetical protein